MPVPLPPAFRNLRTPFKCTALSSLSLRDPAGVVAIRLPASREAAAPRRGRKTGLTAGATHSHCKKTDCHIAALSEIIMCFHTTINERPPDCHRRGVAEGSYAPEFRVGTLLREVAYSPLRMICRGRGGCFITMTGLRAWRIWMELQSCPAGARPNVTNLKKNPVFTAPYSAVNTGFFLRLRTLTHVPTSMRGKESSLHKVVAL